jgi:hypothetical protein
MSVTDGMRLTGFGSCSPDSEGAFNSLKVKPLPRLSIELQPETKNMAIGRTDHLKPRRTLTKMMNLSYPCLHRFRFRLKGCNRLIALSAAYPACNTSMP